MHFTLLWIVCPCSFLNSEVSSLPPPQKEMLKLSILHTACVKLDNNLLVAPSVRYQVVSLIKIVGIKRELAVLYCPLFSVFHTEHKETRRDGFKNARDGW